MALFTSRPASLDKSDDELLVDLMDSQIPWLSSIGSSGQWGTAPIRTARPNVVDRAKEWVQQSEEQKSWGPQWYRAFIAEKPDPAGSSIPAAALVLQATSASYVRHLLPEQDEANPFVYVVFLMSNRKAAEASKGAGSFLLELAKEQAREAGVKRLCLDCYSGNDRRLVRYYEAQGFKLIGDFKGGEQEWPCAVLEMHL